MVQLVRGKIMKKLSIGLFTIGVIVVLIPVAFIIIFGTGMVNTNRAKNIDTEVINLYKKDMKKSYAHINDIKVYYKQGKINFDFNVSAEMTLEDSKQIVKNTRELILGNKEPNIIPKDYTSQSYTCIRFISDKNNYIFKSKYQIPTVSQSGSSDSSEDNTFNLWYFTENNEREVEIEL
jgi:hypothetical protein